MQGFTEPVSVVALAGIAAAERAESRSWRNLVMRIALARALLLIVVHVLSAATKLELCPRGL